jgi:hypothetical protein
VDTSWRPCKDCPEEKLPHTSESPLLSKQISFTLVIVSLAIVTTRWITKAYENDGKAFVGFLFTLVRDHLTNHPRFLFVCFSGLQSLDQRLGLKLSNNHDGGRVKGGC